jgi:hypothetical protein
MIAREFRSVAGWRRVPARMLDVRFGLPRSSMPAARNILHDPWIHGHGLRLMLRPIDPTVSIGHYEHVHRHDCVPIT